MCLVRRYEFSYSAQYCVVEKRIYHGLPDLMTRVAKEELDELGDGIDECNVMYLPQVCYIVYVCVRVWICSVWTCACSVYYE